MYFYVNGRANGFTFCILIVHICLCTLFTPSRLENMPSIHIVSAKW